MVFGIDLGTTHSLIGTGDQLLSNLVASNVNIREEKQVPRDFYSEDVVASYKTDMSMGSEGKLAVKASSIVLKELAEQGSRRYGEPVEDVIISVPAYFDTSQREAVQEAAKIAGLNVRGLINEPTAAAIYVCRDVKDLVVVYDLGGGTFDVSIVDSRMGTHSVVATDGIVVGGDNLDQALTTNAIDVCKVPVRFRTPENRMAIQMKMRLAKEQIQRIKDTVYVDLSEFGAKSEYELTVDRYREMVREVFGETIKRTEYLIHKYVPTGEDIKIIFVGGSTMCPYLRDMLIEELNVEEVWIDIIESDINPDLVVAKGVALYAKMVNDGTAIEIVEDVTKRLCIEDSSGKSITIIEHNKRVPCIGRITVSNEGRTDRLQLRLYQGESLIARNNAYVGTLDFDYFREVEPNEGLVEVVAEVTRDGVIKLSASDVLYDQVAQAVTLTAR